MLLIQRSMLSSQANGGGLTNASVVPGVTLATHLLSASPQTSWVKSCLSIRAFLLDFREGLCQFTISMIFKKKTPNITKLSSLLQEKNPMCCPSGPTMAKAGGGDRICRWLVECCEGGGSQCQCMQVHNIGGEQVRAYILPGKSWFEWYV